MGNKKGQAEIAILFAMLILLVIFVGSIVKKKLITKIDLKEMLSNDSGEQDAPLF